MALAMLVFYQNKGNTMDKKTATKFITAGALTALVAVGVSSWVNMLGLKWWLDAVISCLLSAGAGALIFYLICKEYKKSTPKSDLAKLSHELKSPLTSIKGYLFAIKDGVVEKESIDKFIDIAINESDRMLSMLESTMNSAKENKSARKLNISEFDINELVEEIALECKFSADKKDITIHTDLCEDDCYAKADAMLIREVLINLTENAIKYGKQGGNVNIITDVIDNTIQIKVTDDGIGIPAKHIKHIFDDGYKLTNSPDSHGLGLNIVKEILNAHNKKITVQSTPNKGATFSFELDKADLE